MNTERISRNKKTHAAVVLPGSHAENAFELYKCFFGVDKLLFKDYTTSSLLQAGSGLQAFNNYNAAGTCCFLVSPKRSRRGTTDRISA
jgi:hypothetical protein